MRYPKFNITKEQYNSLDETNILIIPKTDNLKCSKWFAPMKTYHDEIFGLGVNNVFRVGMGTTLNYTNHKVKIITERILENNESWVIEYYLVERLNHVQ